MPPPVGAKSHTPWGQICPHPRASFLFYIITEYTEREPENKKPRLGLKERKNDGKNRESLHGML